ncbi:MAG TPA: hypothetical protein VFK41_03040 [Nocardioidaceae bacterium]|nr:hypothetical protein [Nocardioidaceae bacterium]
MQDTTLDPIALLDEEQRAWLETTMERNRSAYAGWSMEDDEDDNSKEDNDDDADEGEDDDDDSDDSDKDDETDWKAKFEAQQRINRRLEKRTRTDARRIKDLEGGKDKGKPADKDDKPDADKIREEARAEARKEALHDKVADKIEAKASKFADPEDAVAVLLRTHDIDDFIDDDKVDVEAIADALKELGEKKPHLLAEGKRFKGDADGGRRKGTSGRPKTLGDAVAQAYKR